MSAALAPPHFAAWFRYLCGDNRPPVLCVRIGWRQPRQNSRLCRDFDLSRAPNDVLLGLAKHLDIKAVNKERSIHRVTDQNGAGVVMKPENDSSVFYFFLNPLQANATLSQLQQQGGDNLPTGADGKVAELKVSAFSLGKIWFDLLSLLSNFHFLFLH